MSIMNIAQIPPACEAQAPKKPRRRRPKSQPKVRPFTLEQLDKRTAAYAMFESLFAAVQADCGGADQISAVQRELIGAFCSMAVYTNDLSARGLAGQDISLSDLSLAASTLTRLASRIGIARVPRQVGMTLTQLRQLDNEQQQREAAQS